MSKSNSKDVRFFAVVALEQVFDGGQIQEVLDTILDANDLSLNDRHLLSELSYGVLRTVIRLNFILKFFLPNFLNLPLKCRIILQISLYSLLFLQRIPHHAIVFQAVEVCKHFFGQKLSAVVNAALRKIIAHVQEFLSPRAYCLKEDPMAESYILSLARFFSLPTWLFKYWITNYGLSAAILLSQRSMQRPQIAIVLNKYHSKFLELQNIMQMFHVKHSDSVQQLGNCGFRMTSTAWHDLNACFPQTMWHRDGVFSYQAAGSQNVLTALGLDKWTGGVWDMCAGFGGKSAYLLQSGVHVAMCSDVNLKRLSGLKHDFTRLHLDLPHIFVANGCTPPLNNFNGHILIDAPCSGLGVLAKRPDIKLKRLTKRSLRNYPCLQMALLETAARFLLRGKQLAYITCTLNPLENELLINDFLAKHQDFCLQAKWQTPHTDLFMEGMFGVLLQRGS